MLPQRSRSPPPVRRRSRLQAPGSPGRLAYQTRQGWAPEGRRGDRRIAAAVSVPVSADIEAGYGDSPDAVAATVCSGRQAGAVGVNLEDRDEGTFLFETVRAGRPAGRRRGRGDANSVPARQRSGSTRGPSVPDRRLPLDSAGVAAALERAVAYKAAGADSLFVPGLVDLAAIAKLAAGPLPVAVMAWPGAPTVAELTAVGVVRISLGSAIAQAAYGVAARAAAELLHHRNLQHQRGRVRLRP